MLKSTDRLYLLLGYTFDKWVISYHWKCGDRKKINWGKIWKKMCQWYTIGKPGVNETRPCL